MLRRSDDQTPQSYGARKIQKRKIYSLFLQHHPNTINRKLKGFDFCRGWIIDFCGNKKEKFKKITAVFFNSLTNTKQFNPITRPIDPDQQ